jgi:hypothetical protein
MYVVQSDLSPACYIERHYTFIVMISRKPVFPNRHWSIPTQARARIYGAQRNAIAVINADMRSYVR